MNRRHVPLLLCAVALALCAPSCSPGGAAAAPGGGAGSAGASADAGAACTPSTCAPLGAACGSAPDGCGGVLDCGVCPAGLFCGGGGPNQCGSAVCTPKTCASLGAACGVASDGCGGVLECGGCPLPLACAAQNACELPGGGVKQDAGGAPPGAACNWAAGVSLGAAQTVELPGIGFPCEVVLAADWTSLLLTDCASSQRIYRANRPSLSEPFSAPSEVAWANAGWHWAQRLLPTRTGAEVFLVAEKGESDLLDVYRATWDDAADGWTAWAPVDPVNSPGHENNVFLSWDGLSMYLTRNNGDELYVARRSAATEAFGSPEVLAELSTEATEASPSLTSDELTIVFARVLSGVNVMHYATRGSRGVPFGAAAPVPGVPEKVMFPFVREDGCELFYVQDAVLRRVEVAH